MKINKVLLGLFAGVLTLVGGSVRAQFYEVGPANVGGKISSLIVDQEDASHSTIYAGAISGGLFVRTSQSSVLQGVYANMGSNAPVENLVNNFGMWHYVPLRNADGEEITALPISAMVQGTGGVIYIGTGDNTYPYGNTYGRMSMKGRGIYRYDAAAGTCEMIARTNPSEGDMFTAVRALDYYQQHDTFYLFAATSTGLYRWAVKDGDANGWNAMPTCIISGSVDNIVVSRSLNVAYFSMGNALYRMSNAIKGTSALNISSTNPAFGSNNSTIKLAMAPSDNRYVYAMVVDSVGYMENIYVTTNGQLWSTTTTETVMPLSYNSGTTCGWLTVDPFNPKRIIVGGTNIWIGEGFVDGANYMWTKSSYSEFELNGGDYMGSVYNSAMFVHSGIHDVVPVWDADLQRTVYYIATNGGVFSTTTDFYSYNNLNRGLNNLQITSLDVCPDGSIISGAVDNACPFIAARLDHNGGSPIVTWYDYGNMGNFNHDANILWNTSGGKVAASSFYQVTPQSRRNIYVSSNGHVGRSYADYLNYNNPTTWTVDSNFVTSDYMGTTGGVTLWESENDTYFKDSILVGFDLRGYYFDANGDTLHLMTQRNGKLGSYKLHYNTNRKPDTTWVDRDGTIEIKANQKAIFLSKGNAEYPFEFTFTQDFLNAYSAAHGDTMVATVADSFLVKCPVISHAFAIVTDANGVGRYVIYTWMPNDFTRVWDHSIATLTGPVAAAEKEKMIKWADIFSATTANDYPRKIAVSNDGRFMFLSTYNTVTHKSHLRRLKGFENVNYHQTSTNVINELKPRSTETKMTTELFNDNAFTRPISAIAIDPRPGYDRIVVAFEDYNGSADNVIVIDNATQPGWKVSAMPLSIGDGTMPVYSLMIEKETGHIYAGTPDGVYIHNGASWVQYRHLKGIPVTAIVQQTKNLPVRHHLTHTGIEANKHVYAKTKWPGAIYFGTYGRGIFMDTTYVTDSDNEVCDSADYVSVPTVASVGMNSVSIFPNPVMGETNLQLTAAEAGNVQLRIYDLNGRCVVNRNLGYANEGDQLYTLSTEGMAKGMYLVNVIIGGHTAATKMIVR